MQSNVPRKNRAFSVFLLALGGVTISASALLAIWVGLNWDGMPWTIALLAALLTAILSSAHVEQPRRRAGPEAWKDAGASREAPLGAD